MNKTMVGIHQPNFFPWLGYFAKIDQSDVFVFLTEADYPKSGSSLSSYVNRVMIGVGGQPQWWGCPVKREHGPQPISTVRISDGQWTKKKLRTLEQSYAKSPYFKILWERIREMVLREEMELAEYNMKNIRCLSELLGLTTRFVKDSDLEVTSSSTQRLIDITQGVEGTGYISGKGGDKYQGPELFEQAGIELAYTDFVCRSYQQMGTEAFMPGLSVLDALMNCGIEGTRALLQR